MANKRTYVHDEDTLVDSKGNEIVMFHKTSDEDIVMGFKSNVTAVGKFLFAANCDTAAATAAKTVSAPGFKVVNGAHLTVKFTNGITCANATLNVNSTGAKAIHMNGSALPAGVVLAGNQVVLKYNGSVFEVVAGAGSTHVSANNAKKIYLLGQDNANLSGTPANEYYNTTVYIDATGKILNAPYFEGNGSKLTNLSAGNIASGTLNAERLAASGATAGSYGSGTAATLGFGDTFTIPYTTVDKFGRVTNIKNVKLTLPANPDTDVKVTSTANNSVAYYLSGTTSSATATGTLVHNTGVYVSGSRLYAPSMQTSTLYLGDTSHYITASTYTGQAATVPDTGFATHLEDSLSSQSTSKAATANAARKLAVGITSLIGQLGTQATFSLSGTTLTITTKTDPSVSLS